MADDPDRMAEQVVAHAVIGVTVFGAVWVAAWGFLRGPLALSYREAMGVPVTVSVAATVLYYYASTH